MIHFHDQTDGKLRWQENSLPQTVGARPGKVGPPAANGSNGSNGSNGCNGSNGSNGSNFQDPAHIREVGPRQSTGDLTTAV